jgi:transcriptional regulator with XRE-family HTH domain
MRKPHHDWYLLHWLRTLGKKQADIARDLDMNKAKVSLTAHGKQPYDRDDVNAIADYLNLHPYELLMHPDDAMNMRQLRATAEKIATLAHENDIDLESGISNAMEKRRASKGDSARKTGTHD